MSIRASSPCGYYKPMFCAMLNAKRKGVSMKVKSSQVKYGSQIHWSEQKHYLVMMFWSHSLKCSVKGIIMVTEEKPASHGWDSGAPLFPLYNHRQFNLKIPLFREQSCCTHLHLSCKLTYILYLLNTQNLPESPNKIVATDKLRCVL